MKIVIIVVAGLVAVGALMAVIGAYLPREHVATRTATFRNSPAMLFATVRDFAGLPTWRDDLKSVELMPSTDGLVRYAEVSKHGTIIYRVKQEVNPTRLVLEIEDEPLPYGGTWTFDFTAGPHGTQVRITERGFVKPAVFRFLAHYVFGYTSSMDQYLRALGRKFGQVVVPR